MLLVMAMIWSSWLASTLVLLDDGERLSLTGGRWKLGLGALICALALSILVTGRI